jgi:hypothetical protein
MKSKKTIVVALAGAVMMIASTAGATDLNWVSKTCVVIDGTFHVCKPTPQWDTQTKDIRNEAVRWVLHREGANPVIRLIYDSNATGKTAHDYAKQVKKDLAIEGLKVNNLQNRVINGRNVSLINASDPDGKLDYLVAVYRDGSKGLRLMCTAGKDNFSFFSNEFMQAINAVKFVR